MTSSLRRCSARSRRAVGICRPQHPSGRPGPARTPVPWSSRGPLSRRRAGNIEIREVPPSVVQVVAAQSTANPLSEETEGGVASGTGFVWDNNGHSSQNNHVVQNANEVAISLSLPAR